MSSGSEKARAYIRIGNLHMDVRGWPTRPFLATKVFSDGLYKFAINEQGHLFSNHVQPGHSFYHSFIYKDARAIVRGFIQMGVIKEKPVIERLIKAEEDRRAQDQREYAASQVLYHAQSIPELAFTPRQKALLAKLNKGSKK